MPAIRIHVFGKVQGVFYRATTKSRAEELGICGWVMNESNGSVLIEAEGTDHQLGELIKWCNQGPQFARVDDVITEPIDELDYKEFEIRY